MIDNSNIKEIIGFVAGIISLVAYFPYIYSILKHKTRPSRSSWWIWSFVGFLILLSYYNIGARNTIWIPLVLFICPLIVAILSLWFGEGQKLNTLDKICILGAIISLIPWIFLKSVHIALFVNIFIDFLGFLSTFQKTYKYPQSENRFTWTLFFMGSILNVIALENYSFSIIFYPIYMFIMDIVMIYFLFIKPFNFSKNQYVR